MTAFFDYPKAAAFGRVLPKTKVYGHSKAGSRLRQLFINQVDQIIWQYKLAPETINLGASNNVLEIQIFRLRLRDAQLSEDVLRAIDKPIKFPIIYELTHDNKRKAIAAYKRPSEADKSKWVVSEYFSTEWEDGNSPRHPLPSALNLGTLYEKLLSALILVNSGAGESLAARVEHMETIRAKQREAGRIQVRLAREKQFNKRVAINAELRDVKKQLKRLGATVTSVDQGSGWKR